MSDLSPQAMRERWYAASNPVRVEAIRTMLGWGVTPREISSALCVAQQTIAGFISKHPESKPKKYRQVESRYYGFGTGEARMVVRVYLKPIMVAALLAPLPDPQSPSNRGANAGGKACQGGGPQANRSMPAQDAGEPAGHEGHSREGAGTGIEAPAGNGPGRPAPERAAEIPHLADVDGAAAIANGGGDHEVGTRSDFQSHENGAAAPEAKRRGRPSAKARNSGGERYRELLEQAAKDVLPSLGDAPAVTAVDLCDRGVPITQIAAHLRRPFAEIEAELRAAGRLRAPDVKINKIARIA